MTKNTLPVRLAPELDPIDIEIPNPGEYWLSLQPIEVHSYYDDERREETIASGTAILVLEIEVIQGEFHSAKLFIPAPFCLGEHRDTYLTYTADRFFSRP